MMVTKGWSWGAQLGLVSSLSMSGALARFVVFFLTALSGDCARAQITPDGTLGTESSVVTPTNINGVPTNQIDGGAVRGTNLFHSFDQFSVPFESAADFNNTSNIQNIISRVTGSSISKIDGLISAGGTANLFLLNPNGIIFGPNASLSIGGSFLASTASSINFANDTQFSATAPPPTPLLTISVPIGLQFGANAGSILNQSRAPNNSGNTVGLEVPRNKTLALVGGNVSLDGGSLQARDGRVELGGLAGAGTVGLNVDSNNLRLTFPDGVARTTVDLNKHAIVDVRAGGSGSIAINAQNLNLAVESRLLAGIASEMVSVGSVAGDIEINATGRINLTNNSSIANVVESNAVGNGGDVKIRAESLDVTDGAEVVANTRGRGNAGSVDIHARNTVSLDGVNTFRERRVSSAVRSDVGNNMEGSTAVGNAGRVNITAESLAVTNGAEVRANSYEQGDAGSVYIHAREWISFDGVGSNGPSGAYSRVERTGVGNGGKIDIQTGSLSVTNGAALVASTKGRGNAGSVDIHARSTVSFDGDGVDSNGNFYESGAFSRVWDIAEGNSDSINITAESLSVTNGAKLYASTEGSGNAGSVNIHARNTVSFDEVGSNGNFSGAFSTVESEAVGNGGNINITTGSLTLTNGARLSASSESSGAAGNIEVAADSIRLDNQAVLSSDTTARQGNIKLRSQSLVLRHGSNITTNAQRTATGGNIKINTGVIAALENSDIRANAQQGPGGRVIINAQGIFGTQFRNRETSESDITATSNLGPDFSGTVEINTPDVDPSPGLVALPAQLVDASGLIASGCGAGGRQGESEFIVTGRGGLPPKPSDTLSSDTVWTDLRPLPKLAENRLSSAVVTQQTLPTAEQLVEAQGWVINDKGEVVLTATAAPVLPHIPWMAPSDCYAPETSP